MPRSGRTAALPPAKCAVQAELVVERRPCGAVQAAGVQRHALEPSSLLIPSSSCHRRLAAAASAADTAWDLARGNTAEQGRAAAIGEHTPADVHVQVAIAQLQKGQERYCIRPIAFVEGESLRVASQHRAEPADRNATIAGAHGGLGGLERSSRGGVWCKADRPPGDGAAQPP